MSINSKQGSNMEIGGWGMVNLRWGVCFESGIYKNFFEIFLVKICLIVCLYGIFQGHGQRYRTIGTVRSP